MTEHDMRYRVLGPLGLWRGGEEIPLAPAKWRMLLAVLLCDANQVVSTDRLVAELWGARPPRSAGKILQQYVSRVRRALGDESGRLLVTHAQGYRAHGYRLIVRPGEVDAHRFTELVDEGGRELARGAAGAAAELLGEALRLWRDAPFTDVPPTPAVEAETMRLAAYRTQARESHIEARLRLGGHEAVLDELDALVSEHPLREGLRGRLMLALYRAGRQADALAAYRELRHLLAEELGIEPGPPLQQLHQRILRADASLLLGPGPRAGAAEPGEPGAGAPAPGDPVNGKRETAEGRPALVPRELPHLSATFVGRAGESSVLHRLLTGGGQGQVAMAVIDGAGGVGKSALAIHTAHQLADRFPDGQFYVDLHGATAGLTPLEPGEVLGRFLATLGIPDVAVPANTEEAAATFRSLVADRRMLIVLDNAAGVDQVRPLLPAGPGCAVLITSREMLTSLEGATHLHLGVMFHDQATALLERLVGAERVAAEPEATDAIVQMCGRLPLALRIVGARMAGRPGWPLSAFAERLADAQNRLDEIRVGDLSVRASFHAGYDGLCQSEHPTDAAAARAFRFCGVLPGSNVSLQAAAALLGVETWRAEDALERLVDAHLLHSLAPGRYQMHDLIRLFAREQVDAQEPAAEREQALLRVLRFYLATAERAVSFLDVPPQSAWRPGEPSPAGGTPPAAPLADREQAEAWLEAERANLMAAVTHAAARSDAAARLAVRLARPLHWYLYPHARARELRTLADVVIATARRLGDRDSEAWGLDHLSAVHWLHRDYDRMRQSLEAALAIRRETGDRDGERRALGNLADALAELELYEESVAVQRRHLALAAEAGDRMAQVTGLGNLGRAHLGLGRTAEALSCLEESMTRAREIGERALEGLALNEISFILFDEGRVREAQEHMTRATLLPDANVGAYVRWRGYAWSAFFPACLTLRVGPPPSPSERPVG
ncbi:BTAD domain-containing putative transcriptional regulator [Streptomyces naganishii]|uniref:AfsR/SARP family transcriptional regulator n=1 Tax=Streptomyces naganishii TaxID=285447 RepID=UPI0036B0A1FB